MHILVIGASQGIGQAVCQAADAKGHKVRAMSRTGRMPLGVSSKCEAFTGDALQKADVARALDRIDVVVQALGVTPSLDFVLKPVTLFSGATRILLPAMKTASVKKLVTVTGFGAGDSEPAINIFQRVPFKLVFKKAYDDNLFEPGFEGVRSDNDKTSEGHMAEKLETTQSRPSGGFANHRRIIWIAASIAMLLLIGGIAAGPLMSDVEQPKYDVETSDGSIEIRAYGPMIAAEAQVDGQRQVAIREGFGLIAAYIFGANKPNAKVAMTAPVQQQSTEKVAMTAPVTQQAEGNSWTVRFIMPSSYALETLPAPNDPRVMLKRIPARRMIVIRFSGTADDALIQTKTAELRNYASEHKLTTAGKPLFAFYNPPWTLPILRRNEIMLELERE